MLESAPLVWMSAAPTHLARLDRIQLKAMAIIGPDVLLQSLAARRTSSLWAVLHVQASVHRKPTTADQHCPTSCTNCGSSTNPTHTCGDPSSPAPQYPTTSCTGVHQAVLPVCPHQCVESTATLPVPAIN
eukprot:scpid100558/ scgid9781/ 